MEKCIFRRENVTNLTLSDNLARHVRDPETKEYLSCRITAIMNAVATLDIGNKVFTNIG